MNRHTWLAMAASVAMLHSCSNEEVFPDGVDVSGDPVEIRLSSGTQANLTRASIGVGADDADIPEMGVFCLAKDLQHINNGAQEINWFGSEDNWSVCLMDNVKSQKIGSDVTWLDGQHYFYPVSQFYKYDFYGYYPYVEGENMITENSTVLAQFVIDGSQDIIWGKATSDEEYAYSAKYYRTNPSAPAPKLRLKHMLTRLTFSAVPDVDRNGSKESAKKMSVKRIYIKDAYTNLALTVADHQNPEMEGAIAYCSEVTDSLFLKEADGSELQLTSLADESGVTIGESLMLLPAERYRLGVEFVHDDFEGEVFRTECWLEISKGTEDFKAGTSYNVKLTVHGPEEVTLEAELQPWDFAEGDVNIEL